jgi:hypothetical protein
MSELEDDLGERHSKSEDETNGDNVSTYVFSTRRSGGAVSHVRKNYLQGL